MSDEPSRKRRLILIVAILAGVLVLGTGVAYAAGAFDSGPSDEEVAAQEAATAVAEQEAEDAANKELGDSCRYLTEDAFTVLRETEAQLDANGYSPSDYAEQVSEVNLEASSIAYYDDPLCEEAVGAHIDAAASDLSDAEDDWNNNEALQTDWAAAAGELADAENGLDSIYDGSAANATADEGASS